MQTHKMHVVIPKDHRLVVEVPETIHSGPAELIFVAHGQDATSVAPPNPEALARWDAVMADLAADSRDFRELSLAEREQRMQQVRGIGRGILPMSEQVAREKREEIELEETKFGR